MKYKHESIAHELLMHPMHPIMVLHLEGCDRYRRLVLDGKDVTVTDYLREAKGKPSYHPLKVTEDGVMRGNAYDKRLHDFFSDPLNWKDEEREVFQKFSKFSVDYAEFLNRKFSKAIGAEIQVVLHPELWETWNQHIHVELDDGNPVVA